MKLKILAVDDSAVVTEMIRDAFEVEGYRVLTAGDGVEALRLALAENPDLIIADIAMPGMDGWELCSQIRSNPYTSFIPFIFLTQKSEAPDRIRGLQMGADDYLTKPFAMEELLARVKLIFQRILKSQEAMITRGPQTLQGTTKDLSLPDLIQLFALNQKTGLLQISRGGEVPGRLAFQGGKIINAALGQITGLKALYRMLNFGEATFRVFPLTDLTRDPTIPEKVETVIMEAARHKDELERLRSSHPLATQVISTVSSPVASQPLDPLGQRILAVARERIMFQDLLDRVSWPDLEVYRAVIALLEQGLLRAEEQF